jgi:hypothetical protein
MNQPSSGATVGKNGKKYKTNSTEDQKGFVFVAFVILL